MDRDHYSNLSFLCPKEALHEIFSNVCQAASEKKSFVILNIFNKCIGKQTWPRRKKVKCQCTTIILAILVDLPSPMIYAKIQPQGILGSGEEDF